MRVRGKKDNVIVFYASALSYRGILTKFFFGSLAVIAVFRFTSGFPGASGHPAPLKPEPLYIELLRRIGGKILISKV